MKDWNCGICFSISAFDIPRGTFMAFVLLGWVGLGLLCIGMNGWYKMHRDGRMDGLHCIAWNGVE